MKTFHINLLKQYVETDNVEMTATSRRRDFPGETRQEIPGGNWDRGPGCPEEKPQVAADYGIGKIVVGASADYVEEQEDVSVDDEKLLEFGVLGPKESISDVCLGVE